MFTVEYYTYGSVCSNVCYFFMVFVAITSVQSSEFNSC